MRIGIDLGGTSIKGGLVDNNGIIIDKRSRKTMQTEDNSGRDQICEDIIILTKELIEKNNLSTDDIEQIGIGVPGNVDYESGIVRKCVNVNWENVNVKKILEDEFKKSVIIDNDANAAAAGEYLYGSMKNGKNAVLITLGTGVGGGAVLNSKLFRGSNGSALEIGHMQVGQNFYKCSCGNDGCLETFASATAVIRYTKKLIEEGNETKIIDMVNNNLDEINAKVVFDAAKEGDTVALKVVNRFIKYLAIGITNIINILDVDMISIGGGVSAAFDFFKENLVEEIKKYKLFKEIALPSIEVATLGNDAGIIGAAMLDRI
ncbi:ROK family protein [Haloimpatiens sp. FM7330]|uniref:ROK family protein n=1 Tax=Haloimpatiens sp. FM7330 TaxID=3298610 RepID=UPI0036299674